MRQQVQCRIYKAVLELCCASSDSEQCKALTLVRKTERRFKLGYRLEILPCLVAVQAEDKEAGICLFALQPIARVNSIPAEGSETSTGGFRKWLTQATLRHPGCTTRQPGSRRR